MYDLEGETEMMLEYRLEAAGSVIPSLMKEDGSTDGDEGNDGANRDCCRNNQHYRRNQSNDIGSNPFPHLQFRVTLQRAWQSPQVFQNRMGLESLCYRTLKREL